jgi:hypothetical protein
MQGNPSPVKGFLLAKEINVLSSYEYFSKREREWIMG